MFHRGMSFYFLACALISVVILTNESSGSPIADIAIYTLLFPICCSLAAYHFWRAKAAAYIFGLPPCLSIVFRPIGEWAWLQLPPPISLGIPMGDFAAGRGFLFDFFAAILVIRFIYGIYGNAIHYRNSQTHT